MTFFICPQAGDIESASIQVTVKEMTRDKVCQQIDLASGQGSRVKLLLTAQGSLGVQEQGGIPELVETDQNVSNS